MEKDLENTLAKLHDALAKDLLERIKSGEATAADMSNAIRFLKDNGIDAHLVQDSPLDNLAKVLPFQDPDAPIKSTG
jgi:ABC-type Zn uptake system ZnuABC Zn-binding protein ZnuA